MFNQELWGGDDVSCGICQVLWCKYAHQGQFPGNHMTLLNVALCRETRKGGYNRCSGILDRDLEL